jgi:UDP-N-acetylmuramoylalanine--D-glutamate ligase
MLPDLEHIQPDDLVVMELSSFQLEIMTVGTAVAAILNITPNHLDRHKTMQVYTAAKARLLEHQNANGVAVLGRDDPGAWQLRDKAAGRLRSFSLSRPVPDGAYLQDQTITLCGPAGERAVCQTAELQLLGQHNVLNVLAATALADSAGVPLDAIRQAACTFSGVEHRLELVREYGGARWYNDSMATAPERMLAALRSFEEPLVLLAGGRDKDLPWDEAGEFIGKRVRDVVLFGEAAELIRQHLNPAELEQIVHVITMEEAVLAAAKLARPGDVVLLSPGGTSFDAYQDFAERGDHFKQLVRDL